jgi:hypothetical protein
MSIPTFSRVGGEYRNPNVQISDLIRMGDYEQAVNVVNSIDRHHYNDGPIDDPEYRRALINFASPQVLLYVGWLNVTQYPELLMSLGRYQNVDLSSQPQVSFILGDLVAEGVYDAEGEAGERANEALKILLGNGFLNPNSVIDNQPLFMLAVSVRNISLMMMLLNLPNFIVRPEYLTYINTVYEPIDYIRETLIGRLRPTAGGKKRARYHLEDD